MLDTEGLSRNKISLQRHCSFFLDTAKPFGLLITPCQTSNRLILISCLMLPKNTEDIPYLATRICYLRCHGEQKMFVLRKYFCCVSQEALLNNKLILLSLPVNSAYALNLDVRI